MNNTTNNKIGSKNIEQNKKHSNAKASINAKQIGSKNLENNNLTKAANKITNANRNNKNSLDVNSSKKNGNNTDDLKSKYNKLKNCSYEAKSAKTANKTVGKFDGKNNLNNKHVENNKKANLIK